MKITFLGAAENVTGSKHLIESEGFRLLLDCGLYQGRRSVAARLNSELPFKAVSIDAVVLSHAHADHCGLLPTLVKQGFNGNIYCTPATAEVAEYILLDSAKIQENDATYINDNLRVGQDPVYPLYTTEDVEKCKKHFTPTPYFRHTKQWVKVSNNIYIKIYDAGHILGSAAVAVRVEERGVVKIIGFTGDLGSKHVPILHSPEYFEETLDALLMECTYGNKNHRPLVEAGHELVKIVNEAVENKSKIIIPAFALGRTQELIYTLHQLTDSKKIPRIPIYIDSPLGINVTEVFSRHSEDFNLETWGDFGMPGEWPLIFRNLTYVRSIDESKSLNNKQGPFIIIASSGMAEGGRILHHLKNNIEDPNNFILLTGYQAEHTLGRKIQEGLSPVKIFDRLYNLNAKVLTLSEFSAHADQNGLLDYLEHTKGAKKLFLVHTELPQATVFKAKLKKEYPNKEVVIPELGQSFEI